MCLSWIKEENKEKSFARNFHNEYSKWMTCITRIEKMYLYICMRNRNLRISMTRDVRMMVSWQIQKCFIHKHINLHIYTHTWVIFFNFYVFIRKFNGQGMWVRLRCHLKNILSIYLYNPLDIEKFPRGQS